MGVKFELSNIFRLISIISPLMIVFFLVMVSIFNQDLKGMVYLGGLLIASAINILFMNILKKTRFEDEAYSCNLVELPWMSQYNVPLQSSLVITFTFFYILMPMIYNEQMNLPIVISLLSIFFMDGYVKLSDRCSSILGVFMGGIIGGILGLVWYTIFHSSGKDSLLYFDEMASNNVICSRPSKQTFKCSVYKNGELISSNVV
jgi:hypothetical protein